MTRKSMRANVGSVHPFVRNLLALTAWWFLLDGLVIIADRGSSEWPSIPIVLTIGCIVGGAIALWLNARSAAWFLAGQAAAVAVELAMHSYYGIAHVQGSPAHMSVMAAGTLGAVFGTLALSAAPVVAGQRLWNADDVFGSALRAISSLRQRIWGAAPVAAAVAAVGASELGAHTFFGLHPFREGLDHFAIIGAAILGVALGSLMRMVAGSTAFLSDSQAQMDSSGST